LKRPESRVLDVYKIFVKIASDCALKSARAYLVITRLEEIGELVKVVPPVEDLEKENFGDSFLCLFDDQGTKRSA